MTSKYEPAVAWLRVSTLDQSEANQWPSVSEHCMTRGYRIIKRKEVRGKSAFHGAQNKDWQEVVNLVRSGKAKVVVIWKVDRLDRQNVLHAVPMVNAVIAAGGRVEFSSQPYIDLTTMPGRMAFANMCEMAHEESKTKSDRVKAAFVTIDANGGVRQRAKYGYRNVGEKKYGKSLAIAEDQAIIVREAAHRYLQLGESLDVIVADLTSRGIPSPGKPTAKNPNPQWSAKVLGQILRSPTIAGRRMDASGKKTIGEHDPIIDWTTHLAIVARLDSRAYRKGISPSNVALLTSVLFDAEDHPMYRIKTWQGSAYYCRKCHIGVDLAEIDARINELFTNDPNPYMVKQIVPGDNHQDQIERLRQDRAELDDMSDDYDARHAQITAEIRRLATLDKTNPNPDKLAYVDSGRTNGQMWASATVAERRDLMREVNFRITRQRDGSFLINPGEAEVTVLDTPATP